MLLSNSNLHTKNSRKKIRYTAIWIFFSLFSPPSGPILTPRLPAMHFPKLAKVPPAWQCCRPHLYCTATAFSIAIIPLPRNKALKPTGCANLIAWRCVALAASHIRAVLYRLLVCTTITHIWKVRPPVNIVRAVQAQVRRRRMIWMYPLRCAWLAWQQLHQQLRQIWIKRRRRYSNIHRIWLGHMTTTMRALCTANIYSVSQIRSQHPQPQLCNNIHPTKRTPKPHRMRCN